MRRGLNLVPYHNLIFAFNYNYTFRCYKAVMQKGLPKNFRIGSTAMPSVISNESTNEQ